jgi:hypothetical protein
VDRGDEGNRSQAGGIAHLRYILSDNDLFGALESDLKRFYGEDIRGLLSEPKWLTYRQVIVWLRHLPEDAALSRRSWAGDRLPSDRDRLMVAAINERRLATYYYLIAHGGDKAQEPIFIDLDGKEG